MHVAAPRVVLPLDVLRRTRDARARLYPESAVTDVAPYPPTTIDDASQAWLDALGGSGATRDAAVAELHALLLRGARFELNRRRHGLRDDLDDLAVQAADDALVAILGKLDTFRGASRFTTWAYKFVLFEAGVKARRRAWHGREVMLDGDAWPALADQAQPAHETLAHAELLAAIRRAVQNDLSERQREVFTALVLNEVPIDVLAERLGSTRGALYKTLHDARRKLRASVTAAGHSLDDYSGGAA
jgi:RNA polymerase sigma-70 factor (ECF subfamily)